MSDDDLIRRGDVFRAIWPYGVIGQTADIRAIPASSDPEIAKVVAALHDANERIEKLVEEAAVAWEWRCNRTDGAWRRWYAAHVIVAWCNR